MPEIAPTRIAKEKVMEGKVLVNEKTAARAKVLEGKVLVRAKEKTAKAAKRVASLVVRKAAKVRKASTHLTKLSRPGKKRLGPKKFGRKRTGRAAGMTLATGSHRLEAQPPSRALRQEFLPQELREVLEH